MTTLTEIESPSTGNSRIDNTLLIITRELENSVALKIESSCEVEAVTEIKIRSKIKGVKVNHSENIHHHRMWTNETNQAGNS